MSPAVTLSLRTPPDRPVEAECIIPERIATLAAREIAALPIWSGTHELHMGDLFDIHGERSAHLRLEGDLSNFDSIGAGMTSGELIVNGPVGRYVGARMTGGAIRVLGNTGSGAGLAMEGGTLDVAGDTGDDTGAAPPGASKGMLGGEIVVRGSAGVGTGSRMRRGTIICRHTGPRAGEAMIAGNVIVLGNLGSDPGRFNKRGSIVALGSATIPITYRYACTYRPPHVTLSLRTLRARFDLPIDDAHMNGSYRRFSGDIAELGKGEILVWSNSETAWSQSQ